MTAPRDEQHSHLTRDEITAGLILMNPESQRFRVDRVDGETVYCVPLDSTSKEPRQFTFDQLTKGQWKRGKAAA